MTAEQGNFLRFYDVYMEAASNTTVRNSAMYRIIELYGSSSNRRSCAFLSPHRTTARTIDASEEPTLTLTLTQNTSKYEIHVLFSKTELLVLFLIRIHVMYVVPVHVNKLVNRTLFRYIFEKIFQT